MMDYLNFAPDFVPGLNWHEDFIVALASLFRPRIYVELGLSRCELFNRMIPYCEQLIGVDISPEAGNYMAKTVKTRFVLAATEEFAQELRLSPISIDLLFIDADHSREAVIRDFHDYFPFVAPHGLILLHDTHPGQPELIQPQWCGDGYLAAAELGRQTKDYELMTIPISPGLTLCRKRSAQLAWMER
ncbi:MAG: class I SAM-dependent methyltransferase [Desulfitobacteriaceae bacterium]|nr:class I SAM-dependent methyltransferase [Desulfitobacteriaceae bacterium]MDI6880231.1 class I SAM-dependent methyltransferase [Desulfitobacteriaceae bacterium]MDI6915575.1 class I SAM-dependent methyltransferase [Desulfitobacteriaceae bacterium]